MSIGEQTSAVKVAIIGGTELIIISFRSSYTIAEGPTVRLAEIINGFVVEIFVGCLVMIEYDGENFTDGTVTFFRGAIGRVCDSIGKAIDWWSHVHMCTEWVEMLVHD